MNGNQQLGTQPNPPTGQTQATSLPRRIATAFGDWTRSAIVVIAWGTAFAAALIVSWLVIRAMLFLSEIVHRAIFPGGLS